LSTVDEDSSRVRLAISCLPVTESRREGQPNVFYPPPLTPAAAPAGRSRLPPLTSPRDDIPEMTIG